jgi:hypothetical protein
VLPAQNLQDQLGIAVEVEARRGSGWKCVLPRYRPDLVDLDAHNMALLMPIRCHTMAGQREHAIPAYERTSG